MYLAGRNMTSPLSVVAAVPLLFCIAVLFGANPIKWVAINSIPRLLFMCWLCLQPILGNSCLVLVHPRSLHTCFPRAWWWPPLDKYHPSAQVIYMIALKSSSKKKDHKVKLVSWTRPLPPQHWIYCIMQCIQCCTRLKVKYAGNSGLSLAHKNWSALLITSSQPWTQYSIILVCNGSTANPSNCTVLGFEVLPLHTLLLFLLYGCRLSSALERWVCYSTLMILVGAWLGAFPILLDWNRPWQVSDFNLMCILVG